MRLNARWWLLTIVAVASVSCSGSDSADALPNAIRLVDLFDPNQVAGAAAPASVPTRTEWRFDGSPAASVPAKLTATHGWQAGPGVAGLAVQSGQLSGRSTTDVPLIHLERTTGLDAPDMLHSVEIRMRASGGANLAIQDERGRHVEPRRPARDGGPGNLAPAVAASGGRRGSDLHADSTRAHRVVARSPCGDSTHGRLRRLVCHRVDSSRESARAPRLDSGRRGMAWPS